MTVPSGTLQTYQTIGNAEDFEDAVYMISPTETPFLSLAKRMKADNRTHQWLTDELAAHTAGNATIEGDDAAADTAIPAVNLKNQCQLLDKVAFVSNTQEATRSYGNVGSMQYQMAKRVKELKRDLEAALVQNNAGTAGVAASAALMASLESWLGYSGQQAATIKTANGTSVQEGAAGTTPGFTTANGYPVVAPTDSTSTGSISEAILKGCIANTYTNGGDPSILLVPPLVKQKISTAFSGISTRFREVKAGGRAEITGGADLYVSDFGEHIIKPDRFMRSTVMFGIDPDYVGVAYLQPFSQKDLSVTGHAQKKMVWCQATLVLQNPFAHFKIGDINAAK
jgi:uncharacterized protein DUF5309